jgi:predicted ribosomally synthesized peptide with SipW-like signal peptide
MKINKPQGIHSTSARPESRKKYWILAIALAALLCSGITGGTVAYLTHQTDPVVNTVQAGTVPCEVEETFDGTTKSDVSIANTGNTSAYLRATVVITWMSQDESTVYAATPVEGTDYTITYAQNNGWVKGSDGYWYYTSPVAAGETTATLLESCTLTGTAPEGYTLSVEIVASSIQSSPSEAVLEAWSCVSAVSSNQTLTIQ